MPLVAGTRLGPYEIVAPLGAGGMGEVYRARDTRLGRDVAIKALPEEFALDAERLSRFEREAKLLASVTHSNIAGIHGLEENGGHRYLILEFIDGETLADRLLRGPLTLDETLSLGQQVAAGVEAAHENGVVHRDLKPGNIMISEAGGVKVLDFGLAKGGSSNSSRSSGNLSASPTMTYAATQAGIVLGTAAYMSPEQARGRSLDRRTDIWSFGCVLFECLTGRQAFEGETVSDLVARILEREPDWKLLPAGTPPRLRELLRRCLRKDARERLRDIGDARVELEEIARGGGALPEAESKPAASRGASWPLVVGALLVGALGSALVTGSLKPRPTAPPLLRLCVQCPTGWTITAESTDPSISPDGRMLAFSAADSSGIPRLWLRDLGATNSRLLAGTTGVSEPFWSPDGRNLGFFANGQLKRIALDGETIQTLAPAPNPRGGAWSPDGVIVFGPTFDGPLLQIPASGGATKPATTLDAAAGEKAHRFPSFLPDGRHFLYVALPGADNLYATRVGTVGGPPGPVVIRETAAGVYAPPGYILFNRRGLVLAQPFDPQTFKLSGSPAPIDGFGDVTGNLTASPPLAVAATGTLAQRQLGSIDERLEIFDRNGTRLKQLELGDGGIAVPSISPDGTHLVYNDYTLDTRGVAIVVADVARGTMTPVTTSERVNINAVWTPDGMGVVYGSEHGAGRDLYYTRAGGSGGERLIADVPNLFNDAFSISPDGTTVFYTSLGGTTNEDVWSVPFAGGEARPLIHSPANESQPLISPDGQWLAYRSDESGEPQIYVTPYPALDRKYQVSINGTSGNDDRGSPIRWVNGGRELWFNSRDHRLIMAADITPGPEFHSEPPRVAFRLPPYATDFEVSPDGQRIFVILPHEGASTSLINLALNWAPANPR